MFVVGTAGHVDHGKSTLVKALTGIDPDRLREERDRAMTIDLGFAWLTLPGGREVSIIDVPGHERFIKNMLAGVGGIDAALLIVAADEGPMPQTAEHLAILDLLGIARGLVVLTKCDLVDDDWLDLVREETRERLLGTTLTGAPIVAVSATTGAGLDQLLATLDDLLDDTPVRTAVAAPRLPIDRVFSISGFGTVVTGTLSDGLLTVGQEVALMPSGRRGRIRGLQTHQQKVSEATPGSRVAVNLAGVAVEEVRRGDLLTLPGALHPSDRLDARLVLTADAPVELEQNDEIDFFLGADELPARVTLLDAESLRPGASGLVQFRLSRPLAALRGDRFIIRRPSPSITIGGGQILDPMPRRHKRFHPATLTRLETLEAGTPDELVLQALADAPLDLKAIGERVQRDTASLEETVRDLVRRGAVVVLTGDASALRPRDVIVAAPIWEAIQLRLRDLLSSYHRANPLRLGMSKEEVRSRLGFVPRVHDAVITAALRAGVIMERGPLFQLPDHQIAFSPAQQEAVDRFLAALAAQPYAPPSPAEAGLAPEIVAALVDLGLVRRIDAAVVFSPTAYDAIVTTTLQIIDDEGAINVARFRDHFGSSRKYALAVLEHFDQLHITRRVGDDRVRGHAAARA